MGSSSKLHYFLCVDIICYNYVFPQSFSTLCSYDKRFISKCMYKTNIVVKLLIVCLHKIFALSTMSTLVLFLAFKIIGI